MNPVERQREILQRPVTEREKIIALIEYAKQYHASDVTDRTENEYIAEILLDCYAALHPLPPQDLPDIKDGNMKGK